MTTAFQIGDVFESNDRRDKGRRLRIVEILCPGAAARTNHKYVICENIRTGRKTKILLERLGSTRSTDYRLVEQ